MEGERLWEERGYVIEHQLEEDWPVYKVKCPSSADPCAPKHKVFHHNKLLLILPEEVPEPQTQTDNVPTVVSNSPTQEAASAEVDSID